LTNANKKTATPTRASKPREHEKLKWASSVAQVAEVLGKQPNAVRVIQHRALRRLAQHFTVAGTT